MALADNYRDFLFGSLLLGSIRFLSMNAGSTTGGTVLSHNSVSSQYHSQVGGKVGWLYQRLYQPYQGDCNRESVPISFTMEPMT